MTADDDYKTQQTHQQQHQYLDFIEFCLAEYNTDYFDSSQQQGAASPQLYNTQTQNEVNIRNKRKWSKNKIVDVNILNSYQARLKDIFEIFQEHLLLHKIRDINHFTTNIPLSVLFQNSEMSSSSYFGLSLNRSKLNYSIINMKKKLFIDMKTLKILNKSKQINWSSSLISLYPIKTLGDGNCLCHAVLSYLIGMQDINLILRETLKNFMNNIEYTTELKYRWISYRKASDVANSIQIDDKILDTEWLEIINMKANGQADHEGLDKSTSTILETSAKPSSASPSQSLIYLEDIHIFALANLLYRTIIVISLDTIRNIQPIHLRGIYLPLLRRPDECFKDPILIAFHNFHFMPLLFPVDEDNRDENQLEFLNTEKYFHFENIDEMDLKDLDSNEYESFFKFNSPTKNQAPTQSTTSQASNSSSCALNPSLNAKRKKTRFYNTLPLFYYNLEAMKIHFLKENEEKKSMEYLNKYLNLIQLEIFIDDLQPFHFEYLNENHTITVLCCHLHKEARHKRVKNDGITTYLNFLNDSIKKNGYKIGSYKNSNDDTVTAVSPSRLVNTPPITIPITVASNDKTETYETISKLCKSEHCNDKALESSSYYGYCNKCFKKNVIATSSNLVSKKEIEAEKETQQSQFISSHTLTREKEDTLTNNHEKESNERAHTSSSKLLDLNKKLTLNVSRKLDVCSSPKCKNIVQNYSDDHCLSCKESLIADAVRSSSSASSNLRAPVHKNLERINTSRVTNAKSPIQIPVKHETTNNLVSSKISAYNMTPDSKLYKASRSGIYDDLSNNLGFRMGNIGRGTNIHYLEEYDNPMSNAYGQIYDTKRHNNINHDPFNNFQQRNINYPFCSNCNNRMVDSTGASSFCSNCIMSPYTKLYH